MTWAFLLCFREISIAVPFIYRYFVICCGKKWGLAQFLAMLLGGLTMLSTLWYLSSLV